MDADLDHDDLKIAGLSSSSSSEPSARGLITEDFAAAAALAQPFLIYLMVMRFRYPPLDASYSRADPILKLLPREPMMWLVPLIGVALTIVLLVIAFPPWRVWKHALIAFAIGAVLAGGALFATLKLHGPHLPLQRWLPVEESSAPGITFNMMAGYFEEMIFRVGILPLLFFHMGRSRVLAMIGASLATGLAFAALHEAGSMDPVSGIAFAVRFAIPGVFMSLLALIGKPSSVVGLHLTAHVILPLYF